MDRTTAKTSPTSCDLNVGRAKLRATLALLARRVRPLLVTVGYAIVQAKYPKTPKKVVRRLAPCPPWFWLLVRLCWGRSGNPFGARRRVACCGPGGSRLHGFGRHYCAPRVPTAPGLRGSAGQCHTTAPLHVPWSMLASQQREPPASASFWAARAHAACTRTRGWGGLARSLPACFLAWLGMLARRLGGPCGAVVLPLWRCCASAL